MIDIRSHPANFSRSRRIVIWKHTDTRQCRILFLTDGDKENVSSMLFNIFMDLFFIPNTPQHSDMVINISLIQDMMPPTLKYVQENHRLCHNYTSVSCLIKCGKGMSQQESPHMLLWKTFQCIGHKYEQICNRQSNFSWFKDVWECDDQGVWQTHVQKR